MRANRIIGRLRPLGPLGPLGYRRLRSLRSLRTPIGLLTLLGLLELGLVSCTESFSDRCRREAKEYTERECPRLEHQFVIMDSMTYEEEPQGFTYHYRLTGNFDNPELLTKDILDEFTSQMRQALRENLTLRAYKERDFTFTYRYLSDSTDSLVLEARFGPEDYK